ncbi:hypothetical protein QYH69_16505 [Paraburkholderia sp. SARCC-3016]|uniref:hypothetical protein n=1 Tax=Paraburkholderia sp. SARCC-3016 TaxID=3058611 RepID=UPI002808D9BC|nr:hypothetical protein [Paraburkholderia sp. SARCC-3016]MDQ7978850.1 hypothetical protein [Paraburkholderia sp. SARCC-3016]
MFSISGWRNGGTPTTAGFHAAYGDIDEAFSEDCFKRDPASRPPFGSFSDTDGFAVSLEHGSGHGELEPIVADQERFGRSYLKYVKTRFIEPGSANVGN